MLLYYSIGTIFILKKRIYVILEINKNKETYKLVCIEDCIDKGNELIVDANKFSAEPGHIIEPNGTIFEENGIVSIKPYNETLKLEI